jgi:hypothetical protein
VGAQVFSIGFLGDTLYAVGAFNTVGASSRDHLAAFDNTLTLIPTWAPNADDNVQTIAFADNKIYVGGSFSHIEGRFASHFANVAAPQ